MNYLHRCRLKTVWEQDGSQMITPCTTNTELNDFRKNMCLRNLEFLLSMKEFQFVMPSKIS